MGENVMKTKPQVGQNLFILRVGSSVRYAKLQTLEPATVVRVGRKFFYVRPDNWTSDEIPFHLEDWCHEAGGYEATYRLYESERELADEREALAVLIDIRKALEYGCAKRIPLENLRKISELLGLKESEQIAK